MNKLTLFLPALLSVQVAWAASIEDNTNPNTSVTQGSAPVERKQKKENEVSIGLDVQSYTYEEPDPTNIKISGVLPGIDLEYRHHLEDSMFVSLAGNYSSGNLTYDGALQDNNGNRTPMSDSTKDRIYWIQASFGNSVDFSGNKLEFSGGVGTRDLTDKASSQYSYSREESYVYLPLILAVKTQVGGSMTLKFGTEIDIFVSGSNESKLSEVDSRYSDLKFKQDSGSGFGIFARLSQMPRWKVQVYEELAYRTWHVSDSDRVAMTDSSGNPITDRDGNQLSAVEPDNKTQSLNFAVGAMF